MWQIMWQNQPDNILSFCWMSSIGWTGDSCSHKMDAELQFRPVSEPPRRSCGSQLSLRQVQRSPDSREDYVRSHCGWQNFPKGAQIYRKNKSRCCAIDLCSAWKIWIIRHMWICVWWQLARTYSYAHGWMHKGWNCGDFFDEGITNGASWYSLSRGMQNLEPLMSTAGWQDNR